MHTNQQIYYIRSNHKLKQEHVQQLLESGSSLRQLAGIIMARKNMERKEYLMYLVKWEGQIDKNVLNHKFVKREIAGNMNKKLGTEE